MLQSSSLVKELRSALLTTDERLDEPALRRRKGGCGRTRTGSVREVEDVFGDSCKNTLFGRADLAVVMVRDGCGWGCGCVRVEVGEGSDDLGLPEYLRLAERRSHPLSEP